MKTTLAKGRCWLAQAGISLFILALTGVGATHANTSLNIQNYRLISEARIGRFIFEYTYKADVNNNSNITYTNMSATVVSGSTNTIVVDGNLRFGTVTANSSQPSTDTFVIRQDRRYPFNRSNLTWTVTATSADENFTLQLLHFSDIDGPTSALDSAKNFSAIVAALRPTYPNTVLLSSGDNYIPGPRYSAANDASLAPLLGIPGVGRGDIAILNALGIQASGLGNHDLDGGTAEFKSIINTEIKDGQVYPGAQFPYLSTNLDFKTDANLAPLVKPDGQPANTLANSLAGYTTITVGGTRLGVVGATTPALASLTSVGGITITPADKDDIPSLVAHIQPAVDALTAQGINKIILLAHMQQIAVEKQLATLLKDVDVIVAGGSNSLLADPNDCLGTGDVAADTYPLSFASAKGEPVLVVNTDGDYKYLGRLVVEFDKHGLIVSESLDPGINGAYASDMNCGHVTGRSPIPAVVAVADALGAVLAVQDGNVIGKTKVYLDGRRNQVRTQETNFGNLTADANLWYARQVDSKVLISLKNGGGIRDDIGYFTYPPGSTDLEDLQFFPPPANPGANKQEGDISQFDLQNALRFNNGLTLLTLTASELQRVIEHGVAATTPTATPGQFPQIAGVRFSFDATLPVNARVRSLAVVDDSGAVIDRVVENGALVGNANRPFRMITLNFLANGGDSYPLTTLTNAARVDLIGEDVNNNGQLDTGEDVNNNGQFDGPAITQAGLATFAAPGSEQDALAEFLVAKFKNVPYSEPETALVKDFRIQNLAAPRADQVFELPAPQPIVLNPLARVPLSGAEISAYSRTAQRLYVSDAAANKIHVINLSSPASPTIVGAIDTAVYGAGINSVAVQGDLLAAAVQAAPVTAAGKVVFFDLNGTFLKEVMVGALPDMITFTPAGDKLLVANEGEEAGGVNPNGSVGIVNLSNGVANATVATLDFGAFDSMAADLKAAGVRLFPAKTVGQDLEPEYIAVSADGSRAYVGLQEANALAVVDLNAMTLAMPTGLGSKDQIRACWPGCERPGWSRYQHPALAGTRPVHAG